MWQCPAEAGPEPREAFQAQSFWGSKEGNDGASPREERVRKVVDRIESSANGANGARSIHGAGPHDCHQCE